MAWWLQFGQSCSYGDQQYGDSDHSYPWECAEVPLAEGGPDGKEEREREQWVGEGQGKEEEEWRREWERKREEAERDKKREHEEGRERERERERLSWQQKLEAEEARAWIMGLGRPEEARKAHGCDPMPLPIAISPVPALAASATDSSAAAGAFERRGGGYIGDGKEFGPISAAPPTPLLALSRGERGAVPGASASAADAAWSMGLESCGYGRRGGRCPDAPSPLITFPNTTRSASVCLLCMLSPACDCSCVESYEISGV